MKKKMENKQAYKRIYTPLKVVFNVIFGKDGVEQYYIGIIPFK